MIPSGAVHPPGVSDTLILDMRLHLSALLVAVLFPACSTDSPAGDPYAYEDISTESPMDTQFETTLDTTTTDMAMDTTTDTDHPDVVDGDPGLDASPDPCDDPSINVFAGTCWESFWAGCWDATGACTVHAEGSTVRVEWDNGAYTESTSSAGTTTGSYVNSSGVTCSEVTSSYTMSTSTYENPATGDSLRADYFAGGDFRITCPDGSSFYVTATENERAGDCNPTYTEDCIML